MQTHTGTQRDMTDIGTHKGTWRHTVTEINTFRDTHRDPDAHRDLERTQRHRDPQEHPIGSFYTKTHAGTHRAPNKPEQRETRPHRHRYEAHTHTHSTGRAPRDAKNPCWKRREQCGSDKTQLISLNFRGLIYGVIIPTILAAMRAEWNSVTKCQVGVH